LTYRNKALLCPGFLLNKRIRGRKYWLRVVSLCLAAWMTLLLPPAGLAAQAAPGQQAAQQDFLTTIIWTIAALSIAEMIRNSIQGLFSRLYGFNETGVAQKAVGAIAGMGALLGLANVMRATAGGHGGGSGGGHGSGGGGGGIKLSGENALPGGGDGGPGGMTPGGEGNAPGSGASDGSAASMNMAAGQTSGLEKAAGAGNKWGNTLGSFTRGATTTVAAVGMGFAGMAVPGGDRLAQTGVNAFDKTVGAAVGYAGSAAGRFMGVQGSMLGQSWQARKQAQKLTGGKVSVAEGFRLAAGGATMQDAVSRSLKLGGAHAVHEKAGQFVLGGMQRDAAANRPTTGKMDSGVSYGSHGEGGWWDYDW
jgi:hypothetical protein